MKLCITISLKAGVLDPQGQAIANSLLGLGYQEVRGISTRRQIIVDIDESDEARGLQKCTKMCESLLVNTVIEDYQIDLYDESA